MLFYQMLLSIQNFYYPLKRYLEKLPTWILWTSIKNVSKVDFEIACTHHLSRILRYLTKNLSREEVKALNNFRKQRTDKVNNAVSLNRSSYISKLSMILKDTSKLKRVNNGKEKLWIIWLKWKNELYVSPKV